MKKRRWFWITLFVTAMVLLAVLATTWNVDLAYNPRFQDTPWFRVVVGTLGFLTVLAATVLFFVRLLLEMRLTQTQTEFLARISHELKSPITSLELTASLLREPGGANGDTSRLWSLFDSELSRLKNEVDLILETSRWEVKPQKPDLRPLDLPQWLEDALPRWRAILGADAELQCQSQCAQGRAHPIVETDPRLLELITNNIVDNVRKFAHGSPQLTVRHRILEAVHPGERRRWSLSFHDKGRGFSKSDGRRLFKRFYRGETQAPHAIAGTGLGLYLAKTAGKTLGLKIRGESGGIGRGATFTLEGPLP
jgi:two-component system phosphate regulon sensor histidine kinase PhoR